MILNSLWWDKSLIREKLTWDLFRDQNLMTAEPIHVRVHHDGNYYGLFLEINDPGRIYLERNDLDGNGDFYKATNSVEQQQPSLEAYIDAYTKETNKTAGDYSDLALFLDELNTIPNAQFLGWLHANVDIDSELNYQTAVVGASCSDHYHKNHFLYHEPTTGLWSHHIWDVDLAYGRFSTSNIGGTSFNDMIDPELVDPFFGIGLNNMTARMFQAISTGPEPYLQHALYARLWAHLQEKTNESVTGQKVKALRLLLENEHADDIARWGRFPAVPDSSHPPDFHSNVDQLLGVGAFSGNGFLDQRLIYLRAQLSTAGFTGFPWVRITEIMYHPVATDDAEFVEIHNTENTPVDISGWYLDPAGYQFPISTILGAGQTIVIVRDPVVFSSVYPGVSPIFGPYPGKLSNGGGFVRLLDGRPGPLPTIPDRHPASIDSVVYRDGDPWPISADGFGKSLELLDISRDNDIPENWRASPLDGGSPGTLFVDVFLRGDANNDGVVNISDAGWIIDWLFRNGLDPACISAANSNNDERIDVSDVVRILIALFDGGPALALPVFVTIAIL